MNIVIYTTDRDLAAYLKRDAPFDLTITGIASKGTKGLGDLPLYEIAIFVSGLGGKIAADVFSKWLCQKLDGRAKKVAVNHEEVHLEETTLTRCIETQHARMTETRTYRHTNTKRPDA